MEFVGQVLVHFLCLVTRFNLLTAQATREEGSVPIFIINGALIFLRVRDISYHWVCANGPDVP
jgi:hypothetical protein